MRTPVFFDEQEVDEMDTMSSPASSCDDCHLFPTPPASNIANSSVPNDAIDVGDWQIHDQDPGAWVGRRADDSSSVSEENQEGVLILSGDEGDDTSTPNEIHPRRTLIFTHLYQTAMDLSMPGTDSLPSDIGSIDVTYQPSRDETEPAEGATSDRQRQGETESKMAAAKGPFTKAFIVFSAATTFVLVCVIFHLYFDRNSWRDRASQLDQQLAEARNQTMFVMGIMSGSRNNGDNDKAGATEDEFDWENDYASQQVVLTENCWFKATLQLGDCASNAKDCFTDMTSTVMSSFSNLGKTLYSRSSQAPLHIAGATLEGINEASYLVASATVAATDSMRAAFNAADKAVVYAVEQTRDAIQDASVALEVD